MRPRQRRTAKRVAQSGSTDAARATLARLMVRLAGHIVRDALRTTRNPGPKNVHDLRIDVRRLRAVLRSLASELNPRLATELQFDLKNVTRETGPLRDADVSRSLLLPRIRDSLQLPADVKRNSAVALEQSRVAARRALRLRMRDPAWAERLGRIRALAKDRELLASLTRPLTELARGTVGGQVADLRRRMRRRRLGADRLHRLRMRIRDARYTAEALLPLLARRPAPIAGSLHELQDALGSTHDLIEARRLLAQGTLPVEARDTLAQEMDASIERQLRRCRKRLRRIAENPPLAWLPWLA